MKRAFALILVAMAAPPVVHAQDDDAEIYNSLLTCAAFHTIEATKVQGNAAAAQTASAIDYAEAASAFAPDGRTETANADLKTMLDSFQTKLQEGEPRAMAEQWTALESSCAELHPLKQALVAKRKAGTSNAQPESR